MSDRLEDLEARLARLERRFDGFRWVVGLTMAIALLILYFFVRMFAA